MRDKTERGSRVFYGRRPDEKRSRAAFSYCAAVIRSNLFVGVKNLTRYNLIGMHRFCVSSWHVRMLSSSWIALRGFFIWVIAYRPKRIITGSCGEKENGSGEPVGGCWLWRSFDVRHDQAKVAIPTACARWGINSPRLYMAIFSSSRSAECLVLSIFRLLFGQFVGGCTCRITKKQ